MHNYPI